MSRANGAPVSVDRSDEVLADRDGAGQEGLDVDVDRWLVDKARSGDVDAYEVLVRRHRGRIYRIALRMMGNPHDAEDVAQDVVIQVWTALAGFTGSSSFTTWVYRIVVNRCLNALRRQPRTRPILDTDPPPDGGAEDMVVAKQRAHAALEAVAALPPDQRAVIVLHQIEGLSYREVAAIVNVSEDAVRGRLHRARTNLLHSLRGWS